MEMEEIDFPALYRTADAASLSAQKNYFCALKLYLYLLVTAAIVAFGWAHSDYGALLSATLFLITTSILLYLKVNKPEEVWYSARAVAESVKSRTWRWIMKSKPYDEEVTEEQAQRVLLSDLKTILQQNRSLLGALEWTPEVGEAIPPKMIAIRELPWREKLTIYKRDRIDNQSTWYSKKSKLNKRRASQWLFASIVLHFAAVLMLLYRIKEPETTFPVVVVAVAASAILTWVQAKKYNELNTSYSLAAHEIVLIKGECVSVQSESQFSEFVVDCESAFSREHTQWVASKLG